MTTFVTQCPHCRTSFRVSRAQLAAARGVVRCGACLELFNAAQQLSDEDKQRAMETPRPSTSVPLPPPAPPAAPSKDDTLWIHDDLDLDSLDLDEELAKLEREELELARELLQLEQTQGRTAPVDDEAWAERLLGEQTPTAAIAPTARDLDEPQVTAPDAIMLAPEPALPPPAERLEPSLTETDQAESDAPSLAVPATQPPTHDRKDRDAPLFELEDEPLHLDWQTRRRPWGRWLGWGALNLLALLALAGQYVAYNFDDLARQEQYRPWFETICPLAGCELPSRVDVEQIRSSNLVVRSHPDFTGALVVDAIIYNRAPFAQPFPLLEIRFTDIGGKVLSSRTFKPGEYLSGELAGQRQMPSQVPIHIALDILDPGTQAVSYSLAFHSPE